LALSHDSNTPNNMIVKVIKYLVALVALLAVLLIALRNFSEGETRYECKGTITHDGTTEPILAYVKFTEYRLMLSWSGESYGNLHLEFPNRGVEYFSNIRKVGDQLQIMGYDGRMKGNFSTLSGALFLKTNLGLIEGRCVRIEKL